MTDKEIFCQDLLNYGTTGSLVVVAGDTCPCFAFGHADGYSAEWHRLNSDEDDCNSTGIINKVLTTTSIKAYFFPAGAAVGNRSMSKEILEAIGEVTMDDYIMFGTVKVSDGSFVDMSGLTYSKDYVIFDSKYWTIHNVYDLRTSAEVGQWIILKRSLAAAQHVAS